MTDATSADIAISAAEGIQTIRLTRPGKKNALTSAMYSGLAAALRSGDADPLQADHHRVGVRPVQLPTVHAVLAHHIYLPQTQELKKPPDAETAPE